jgi:L-amino acid N-acyltransferase YncA
LGKALLSGGAFSFCAIVREMPHISKLRIRPATPQDMAAVAAIYAPFVQCGTATFELAPPTADEMLARFDAITNGNFPFFVAASSEAVFGFAYAGPFRSRPAFRYTVENSIYVAPGSQNQGVGTALLQALIDDCTQRGLRQMVAVIGDSAAQATSIRLHERAGFRRAGQLEHVGYKNDQWLDIVFLVRPLGHGETTPPAAS